MIKQLDNRFKTCNEKRFAIYLMDDYAVHLMPKIRQEIYKKGYIFTIISGDITDNIQINDKHRNRILKSKYREYEMQLMLKQLEENRTKISDETMYMAIKS